MHVAGTDADTCASAAFGPSRRAQVRDNGKPVELALAEDRGWFATFRVLNSAYRTCELPNPRWPDCGLCSALV